MLNLPQKTLLRIKEALHRQQKDVDERIKSLDKEDPIMSQTVDEAGESGTDSWMAEVHGRMTTLKGDMLDLSTRIKNSLFRIRKGTYGKCECCGKDIEEQRLEAMPTATLCITCSKKKCPPGSKKVSQKSSPKKRTFKKHS
ncbi:MAG: TraR/DksA C4-type zinc finger protein [Candidatus Daviesbacteria bacterium]|nr:TraR/DksA C4-type zinc finger protein [Candidatus Daviesbacteria bacterium]